MSDTNWLVRFTDDILEKKKSEMSEINCFVRFNEDIFNIERLIRNS